MNTAEKLREGIEKAQSFDRGMTSRVADCIILTNELKLIGYLQALDDVEAAIIKAWREYSFPNNKVALYIRETIIKELRG